MLINGPNNKTIKIDTIILDLNGTLANYGQVLDSTKQQINKLKKMGYRLVLISGDIRGNAAIIAKELDLELLIGRTGEEKAKQMQQFTKSHTAAIGNARIDIGTFKNAELSIATLQAEGIHTGILPYVDIIVPSIDHALTLFIEPKALEASLRI